LQIYLFYVIMFVNESDCIKRKEVVMNLKEEITVYLEFLKAESLWDYALGYEKIPKANKIFQVFPREMFKSAREFGKICTLPFLDYATSTPNHRELDDDFIKVYNAMVYAIIESIKNLSKNQTGLSLSNIVLIAKTYSNNERIKDLIDQIFTPDYSKPFNIQAEILNNEIEVRKIVKNFVMSLLNFIKETNISLDNLKDYILFNQGYINNTGKSK